MRTDATNRAVGRAKTVLVSPNDDRAVTTTVVGVVQELSSGQRVRFAGELAVDGAVTEHVRSVVLPLVDRICQGVGVRTQAFEISVLNLNATSAKDMPASLSGRSADVPIFLALFSAAFGMPVRQDVLTTGQLASCAGDIALVSGLPAKAAAAALDPDINLFLYPSLERDVSLETLTPGEHERIQGALAQASAGVRIAPVSDIADLLETVLDDDAIVACSLQHGFFEGVARPRSPADALAKAVYHLTDNNEKRLWKALETPLFAGQDEAPRELLNFFVKYWIARSTYPSGFGARLMQLLRSLPPSTRRGKISFPLALMKDCICLSQFAQETDSGDILHLYQANLGKPGGLMKDEVSASAKRDSVETDPGENAVDVILNTLNPEVIEATILRPIDDARLAFATDSVVVESWDEFMEVAAALYCQFLRYTDKGVQEPNSRGPEDEALALIERAFAREGGSDAAYGEASRPSRLGGMRYVLDVMTTRHKAEVAEKHLLLTVKKCVDSKDYKAKVEFVEAFLGRFAPFLPTDIRERPPQDFATEWETLARAYARSLDAVRDVLRRL